MQIKAIKYGPIFLLLLWILCSFGCRHSSHQEKINSSLSIKEGAGIENIELNRSTKEDVIAYFGKDFTSVIHNQYSIEMVYHTLGCSFYYLISDPKKQIQFIDVRPNFNGKTEKGFDIKTMTLSDVFRLYGNPDWRFSDKSKQIEATYSNLGIGFSFSKREKLPANFPDSYSLDDINIHRMFFKYFTSKYGKSKIDTIEIYTINPKIHRVLLGRSSIDSVFRIKLSQKTISFLDHRILLTVKPFDNKATIIREDALTFKKNGQCFYMDVADLNQFASAKMLSDIKDLYSNKKRQQLDYTIQQINGEKGLKVYYVEQKQLNVNDDIVLAQAYVINTDNTIMRVDYTINSNAISNIKSYRQLALQLTQHLQAGSRRTDVIAKTLSFSFDKTRIHVQKPANIIYSKFKGPDFDVYRFEKLTPFNTPQSSMLIYWGNHPSYLSHQNDKKQFITQSVDGKLQNIKAIWRLSRPTGQIRFPIYVETMITNKTNAGYGNTIHLAITAYSLKDLRIFKNIISGTDFKLP